MEPRAFVAKHSFSDWDDNWQDVGMAKHVSLLREPEAPKGEKSYGALLLCERATAFDRDTKIYAVDGTGD